MLGNTKKLVVFPLVIFGFLETGAFTAQALEQGAIKTAINDVTELCTTENPDQIDADDDIWRLSKTDKMRTPDGETIIDRYQHRTLPFVGFFIEREFVSETELSTKSCSVFYNAKFHALGYSDTIDVPDIDSSILIEGFSTAFQKRFQRAKESSFEIVKRKMNAGPKIEEVIGCEDGILISTILNPFENRSKAAEEVQSKQILVQYTENSKRCLGAEQ